MSDDIFAMVTNSPREETKARLKEILISGGRISLSRTELLHILHMRSIGYGSVEITVRAGAPVHASSVTSDVDYTKEFTNPIRTP